MSQVRPWMFRRFNVDRSGGQFRRRRTASVRHADVTWGDDRMVSARAPVHPRTRMRVRGPRVFRGPAHQIEIRSTMLRVTCRWRRS